MPNLQRKGIPKWKLFANESGNTFFQDKREFSFIWHC